MDLAELVSPWRLTSPAFIEIDHRRRASRAWWVESLEGRFVTKLSFDRPSFVEPGLRVAAAIAGAGVATGPPVRTKGGDVCVEVARSSGGPWTLALLAAVPGEPLVPSWSDAAQVAGDLLGRVHAFLRVFSRRQWVPAELLEWSAAFALATGNERAAAVVRAIADRSDDMTFSVVYGDPSPEILMAADGAVGLIDWGTPSWGPQLHDVAAWLRWLGERPGSGSEREARFLGSYREHAPLSRTDLDLLSLFGRYGSAFGFGPAPGPSGNGPRGQASTR